MRYDYKTNEKKWQTRWEEAGIFHAENNSEKQKFYALIEFPYPSGQGLHIGHPRPYTALDIVARKRRMQGQNVLFPIGWDAFGLPTENYAIKTKTQPALVTQNNIKRFTEQCKAMGFSFDWSREIDTTDPNYYKWTQWIFLKMFEKGLAYKKKMAVAAQLSEKKRASGSSRSQSMHSVSSTDLMKLTLSSALRLQTATGSAVLRVLRLISLQQQATSSQFSQHVPTHCSV